ncbi:MAG: hypothetical protein CVU39_16995 [Chloroflexi bacterium HGW-Chloroflexi-10]|jgi:hypothetical protein|nr:MAG: hypothetical protein CVU39_16995 [Chloroflexi bacterium HGW-Chloroflexi-10]
MTVNEIFQKVYQKFPEVAGKKPTQRAQPDGNILYIFKGEVRTENGAIIPRIVRVIVNDKGKILKMTTSR